MSVMQLNSLVRTIPNWYCAVNTNLGISSAIPNWYKNPMRCGDIRLANLRKLVAEFKTVAEVARRAEVSEVNLRNILNGALNAAGNPKGIGPGLAKKLESIKPKLASGWLDQIEYDEETLELAEWLKTLPKEQRIHLMGLASAGKNVTKVIPEEVPAQPESAPTKEEGDAEQFDRRQKQLKRRGEERRQKQEPGWKRIGSREVTRNAGNSKSGDKKNEEDKGNE